MKKNYLSATPYLYFIAILLWIYLGNWSEGKTADSSIILLFFTIPFMAQIFLKSVPIDIFLIAICTLFTSWMALAYFSDAIDITTMTQKAGRFILIGGLLTICNILMTGWLLLNLKNKGNVNSENNFA